MGIQPKPKPKKDYHDELLRDISEHDHEKRINAFLDAELFSELRQLAGKKLTTIKCLLHEAIEDIVNKYKRK